MPGGIQLVPGFVHDLADPLGRQRAASESPHPGEVAKDEMIEPAVNRPEEGAEIELALGIGARTAQVQHAPVHPAAIVRHHPDMGRRHGFPSRLFTPCARRLCHGRHLR
jgi:hypothetical protein